MFFLEGRKVIGESGEGWYVGYWCFRVAANRVCTEGRSYERMVL